MTATDDTTTAAMHQALRRYFGYQQFRPLQHEIIGDILGGNDTFVLMPTGGGKSLCYQIPALLLPGVTVVVSPLIALMKDQVDGLTTAGVPATFINSTLDVAEANRRKDDVLSGRVKLLYVAPERLVLPDFLSLLNRANVALVAIDEAHCISEWGHDFRVEYRRLTLLRQKFPTVPIVALTATANQRVQQDIIEQLQLRNPKLHRAGFNRPNLSYAVLQKTTTLGALFQIVERHRGESGIIYCGSRDRTEKLTDHLRQRGYRALPYHAGLDRETRTRNQEAFDRDDVEIICATIAFGMGIDKSNVRYIIHYDLPKNIMGYYQETGRAGRDGLPSECVLFHGQGDRAKQMRFIEEKPDPNDRAMAIQQLDQMVAYAETLKCRRAMLLHHFSDDYTATNCGNCDNCTNPAEMETVDVTRQAQMLMSCVIRLQERFGAAHVVEVLRGSNGAKILNYRHNLLPTYGIGAGTSKSEWMWIARKLVADGYLRQDAEAFNALQMTERGRQAIRERQTITVQRRREEPTQRQERERSSNRRMENVPDHNVELFQRLRELRKRIADNERVPAYIVFGDNTLIAMATRLPRTLEEMRMVSGVGEMKTKRYGAAFLQAIAEFLDQQPSIEKVENEIPDFVPPEISDAVLATLHAYRPGMNLWDLAAARQLAKSTVLGHLESLVSNGEIDDITGMISPEKIAPIRAAFRRNGLSALRPVMDELPADFATWDELRLVRADEYRQKSTPATEAAGKPY
ncbi:MAG: DNA helicase RecQ [Chlorobi bacterium CHB2]|nr:DNA helicase RecQ [Chlorobi bacterium CHB2]